MDHIIHNFVQCCTKSQGSCTIQLIKICHPSKNSNTEHEGKGRQHRRQDETRTTHKTKHGHTRTRQKYPYSTSHTDRHLKMPHLNACQTLTTCEDKLKKNSKLYTSVTAYKVLIGKQRRQLQINLRHCNFIQFHLLLACRRSEQIDVSIKCP